MLANGRRDIFLYQNQLVLGDSAADTNWASLLSKYPPHLSVTIAVTFFLHPTTLGSCLIRRSYSDNRGQAKAVPGLEFPTLCCSYIDSYMCVYASKNNHDFFRRFWIDEPVECHIAAFLGKVLLSGNFLVSPYSSCNYVMEEKLGRATICQRK